jgi:hypothetical protein
MRYPANLRITILPTCKNCSLPPWLRQLRFLPAKLASALPAKRPTDFSGTFNPYRASIQQFVLNKR